MWVRGLAERGDNCYIELLLRANWGSYHLYFESGIYANLNLYVITLNS